MFVSVFFLSIYCRLRFIHIQLPGAVNFTTTEELVTRRELAGGVLPADIHYIAVQDHILVIPNHLYQAVSGSYH